jgi:hypothetical protein
MKFKVHAKMLIPADQQRYIFEGKDMSDERRLMDYGIHNDSTLHMVLRLRPRFNQQ